MEAASAAISPRNKRAYNDLITLTSQPSYPSVKKFTLSRRFTNG
jgi:hypothetical protein